MSLLNRTKSYFFLVCVLMCGFLSLLTWHLLYGTYNITIFKGSEVNHLKKTAAKARLATQSVFVKKTLKDLAVDKLTGRMLPMFHKQNIKEIMHKHIYMNPDDLLKNIKASKSGLIFKSTNQSASSVIRINGVKDFTNQKAGSSTPLHNNIDSHFQDSDNQSLHRTEIPVKYELAGNSNVLENVWSMYKERTDKLNAKLKNGQSYNKKLDSSNTGKHFSASVLKGNENNLDPVKVSPSNKNNVSGDYTIRMLSSKQDITAVKRLQILSSNHSDTSVDKVKISGNHGDTSKDKIKIISSNHGDTSIENEEILQSNHGNISQVSNQHGNNSKTKTEMLPNGSLPSTPVKQKHIVIKDKTDVTRTNMALNHTNRTEIISSYEHSPINSSKLQQLKKNHPWLVLANFDHLDDKVTFRPDYCQSCFKPDFPILIDQKTKCRNWNKGKLDLLILIFSAPLNFIARDVIRNTWGKICHDSRQSTICLFVIGVSKNSKTNKHIRIENSLHSDILQIGFRDSYSNLTYKTVSSLQWADQNCYQVQHVMKTDDDMYINTELIPRMLKAAPTKKFFGGHCWGPSRPIRDSFSKWFVSLWSYKRDKFPAMCSGTGYIMSIDIVSSIIEMSKNIPFFHLEDVYVALCLQQLGISPVNIVGFSNMFQEFDACRYRNKVMTSHQISSQYLKLYWDDIQQCPASNYSAEQLFIALPFLDTE